MKIRLSRINAQSPKRPKVVAEKGGRIFATVRYYYCCYYYYYYYYYYHIDAEFTIIIRQTELQTELKSFYYILFDTIYVMSDTSLTVHGTEFRLVRVGRCRQ